MVIKSWQSNWENLSHYFHYSGDIRRLIYTTNAIEAFHRQVRKFTKTKGAFTRESALCKLVYCACQKIAEKWTAPLSNWALTISQLHIYFEGRHLGWRPCHFAVLCRSMGAPAQIRIKTIEEFEHGVQFLLPSISSMLMPGVQVLTLDNYQ